MTPQYPGFKLYLQLIGIVLIFAGVVVWMRFANSDRSSVGVFRSRDALLVSNPKRNTMEVTSISGKLVGIAATADSVEVWSSNKVLLSRVKPSRLQSFTARFGKRNSANIAFVARARGRLLAIQPGRDIDDFSDIQLGAGKFVTFVTRFIDFRLEPVQVDLFGDVRVGDVTLPLGSDSDLEVSGSGHLNIQGLPTNGFISLGIRNREYAQTFALRDIALRSDATRLFPKVKVYPANQIRGKIVDTVGRPVLGTRVVIESNIRRFQMPETHTDKQGYYSFSRLPNGVFSIQALSSATGDMCTAPVSGIQCSGGDTVDLQQLTFAKGNYIEFEIDDKSNLNTQPVFLEISGMGEGRRWITTHIVFRDRPTRVLVPSGVAHFQASQQPRNGIMPSFRNVSISPETLDVRPTSSQKVVVHILQRRR
jgi:hypothetical protein